MKTPSWGEDPPLPPRRALPRRQADSLGHSSGPLWRTASQALLVAEGGSCFHSGAASRLAISSSPSRAARPKRSGRRPGSSLRGWRPDPSPPLRAPTASARSRPSLSHGSRPSRHQQDRRPQVRPRRAPGERLHPRFRRGFRRPGRAHARIAEASIESSRSGSSRRTGPTANMPRYGWTTRPPPASLTTAALRAVGHSGSTSASSRRRLWIRSESAPGWSSTASPLPDVRDLTRRPPSFESST